MKTYKVTGTVQVEVVTLVEADNEEEAEQIAQDRETSICIHGSEFSDGLSIENDEFVLVDGQPYGYPVDLYAEECDDYE